MLCFQGISRHGKKQLNKQCKENTYHQALMRDSKQRSREIVCVGKAARKFSQVEPIETDINGPCTVNRNCQMETSHQNGSFQSHTNSQKRLIHYAVRLNKKIKFPCHVCPMNLPCLECFHFTCSGKLSSLK